MVTATYTAQPSSSVGQHPRHARSFYAPELDGLRFLAFILVFFRHVVTALGLSKARIDAAGPVRATATPMALQTGTSPAHAGWSTLQGGLQSLDFGVCLFFFLSAFLITRLLLIERQTTGKVAVRDFYARRSLRIWPLYFFFIALVIILSFFVPVLKVSPARVWVTVLFVANWAAVFHGWQGMALQPLWSVSVEEQFYVVWPNFARFGRKAIIAASAALGLLSICTLIYYGHRAGTEMTQVWPNTFVQSMFLSAGALTACLSSPEKRGMRLSSRLGFLALGLVLWVSAGAGFHVTRTESPRGLDLVIGYLLVLIGTFLIFTAVAGWRGRAVPRWLLYLGKISYGLYVFHVACLLVCEVAAQYTTRRLSLQYVSPYLVEGLSALVALLLTVTCASLSYSYIEKPFLRLKKHFTVIDSRPV